MAALKVNRGLFLITALVVMALFGMFTVSKKGKGTKTVVVKEAGKFMTRAPTPQTADADTTSDTISAIGGHLQSVEKKVETSNDRAKVLEMERKEAIAENKKIATRFEKQLSEYTDETDAKNAEQMEMLLGKIDELIIVSRTAKDEEPVVSKSIVIPNVGGSGLQPAGIETSYGFDRGEFVQGDQMLEVFWIEPLDDSLARRNGDVMPIDDVGVTEVAGDPRRNSVLSRGMPSSLLKPLESNSNRVGDFVDKQRAGIGKKREMQLASEMDQEVPVIRSIGAGGGAGRSRGMIRFRRQVGDVAGEGAVRSVGNVGNRFGRIDESNSTPHFTIPDTSLLAHSTATTALVGKVFLTGDIVNPRLFKVKVGKHNLTSNGVSLPPEIEGMVLEGYAVGEYNSSCVRGILTAGTYVFHDGTVRSMYPNDAGSRPSGGLDRIGYISDKWGNDCLPGKLISGGARYLGQTAILAGLVGYSEAIRAAQTRTTSVTLPDGTLREENQIEGNPDSYAAASALAGGVDATVEYVEDRLAATTDIIYLPAGQRVDIHIQQELRIDIPSNARKIRYKRSSHVTNSLD